MKECKWKGRELPCSAIFVKFPTDQGLCCSFNLKAANELFHAGTFSRCQSYKTLTVHILSMEMMMYLLQEIEEIRDFRKCPWQLRKLLNCHVYLQKLEAFSEMHISSIPCDIFKYVRKLEY